MQTSEQFWLGSLKKAMTIFTEHVHLYLLRDSLRAIAPFFINDHWEVLIYNTLIPLSVKQRESVGKKRGKNPVSARETLGISCATAKITYSQETTITLSALQCHSSFVREQVPQYAQQGKTEAYVTYRVPTSVNLLCFSINKSALAKAVCKSKKLTLLFHSSAVPYRQWQSISKAPALQLMCLTTQW